jgi:hypothetical protein
MNKALLASAISVALFASGSVLAQETANDDEVAQAGSAAVGIDVEGSPTEDSADISVSDSGNDNSDTTTETMISDSGNDNSDNSVSDSGNDNSDNSVSDSGNDNSDNSVSDSGNDNSDNSTETDTTTTTTISDSNNDSSDNSTDTQISDSGNDSSDNSVSDSGNDNSDNSVSDSGNDNSDNSVDIALTDSMNTDNSVDASTNDSNNIEISGIYSQLSAVVTGNGVGNETASPLEAMDFSSSNSINTDAIRSEGIAVVVQNSGHNSIVQADANVQGNLNFGQ